MNVLVDTCVWSLALRKKKQPEYAQEIETLAELIRQKRVFIIGPIRQELLTAIPNPDTFNRLKEAISAFPDLKLHTEDFVQAAEFSNICRKNGIQGSHTDFLICAVAHRLNLAIYSIDRDFCNYASVLPIKLFEIKG